jgi:hypothetical protein
VPGRLALGQARRCPQVPQVLRGGRAPAAREVRAARVPRGVQPPPGQPGRRPCGALGLPALVPGGVPARIGAVDLRPAASGRRPGGGERPAAALAPGQQLPRLAERLPRGLHGDARQAGHLARRGVRAEPGYGIAGAGLPGAVRGPRRAAGAARDQAPGLQRAALCPHGLGRAARLAGYGLVAARRAAQQRQAGTLPGPWVARARGLRQPGDAARGFQPVTPARDRHGMRAGEPCYLGVGAPRVARQRADGAHAGRWRGAHSAIVRDQCAERPCRPVHGAGG